MPDIIHILERIAGALDKDVRDIKDGACIDFAQVGIALDMLRQIIISIIEEERNGRKHNHIA